jgi:type IV pilus assembly protein PilB
VRADGLPGRKGIFEIFVSRRDPAHDLRETCRVARCASAARELGMRTLREDGLRKVVAGMTTLDEVLRVTMGDATDER